MPTRIAGMVLAAGGSRRLGQPKQLLRDSHGVTLVEHAVQTLQQGGCETVVVVTGREHDAIKKVLANLTVADPAVTIVQNVDWESGMASSVRCGIHAVQALMIRLPHQGTVIAACDMPAVTPQHVADLVAHSSNCRFRVCTAYAGSDRNETESTHSRGNPAFFPLSDWTDLELLTGDRGARSILDRDDTLSVSLRNASFDIDTPADLALWRAGLPYNPDPIRP